MSVSIQLHPLAVLNISDHLTRAKYLTGKDSNYRVVGALLGKQNGRSLDIVNTVEIKFASDGKGGQDRSRIDEAFCNDRLEAYKKLFPDLECIGWYSAAKDQTDMPALADAALHKKFQRFTESPLLAILNPESVEALKKKTLPLFVYELDNTTSSAQFIRLDYSLATSDSERIAVDHIAKATDASTTTSLLSTNMVASLNALKLLRRKIRFLVDMVRQGPPEVRANHTFMRRLQQICAQLPIAERADFEAHAFSDYADVAAVNMLATVLKASE